MRSTLAIASVVLVVAYAGLSGLWVANSGEWYLALEQPWWQPPNWVFGVIWPYNFIMLGWVSVRAMLDLPQPGVWFAALLASIAAAIAWSYFFYVPHQLGLAAGCLALAALVTLVMTAQASGISAIALAAFIPYQLWLLIAASLSIGYWRLNA